VRRPKVSAWGKDRAGHWDKACGVSDAQTADSVAELENELDALAGKLAGGCLLDLQKFYDSLSLQRFAQEAIIL
jgi:hypothetical protein